MRAVLLVDHGSRQPAAAAHLEAVAEDLRRRLPGQLIVTAHMEIAMPTFADGAAQCVEAGAREVVVHPFFLSPGRHVTVDLPRLLEDARLAHPHVEWRSTVALGQADGVAAMVVALIEDRAAAKPDQSKVGPDQPREPDSSSISQ